MKYIFFDVDGTLVDNKEGKEYISQSSLQTLKKLKENGHVLAIATGRSLARVLDVAKRLDIDNIVSDGGYGLMMNGQVIYLKPLHQKKVMELSQELLYKQIPFAYMCSPYENYLYASSLMLCGKEDIDFEGLDICIKETISQDIDVYKVFMAISENSDISLQSIDLHKIMRYRDNCLAYEPDDKYSGMIELVKRMNGKKDDIVFFGDGLNDRDVFFKVKHSIAMGNAIDELKDMAYFVTKDIDDNGIEYACRYFQFID